MAPEFAPSVVIYDLTEIGEGLGGTVRYIERPMGMRVRVRWVEEEIPKGFVPIGDGVAYVLETDDLDLGEPRQATVGKTLDGSRYLLPESRRPGEPWRMLIIIFPAAHTVVTPVPLPKGAKDFNGRLALFWVLTGDKLGRGDIEWQLDPVQGDPLAEFRQRMRDRGAAPKEAPAQPLPESNLSVVTDDRPLLFLSYSHEDQDEKKEVLTHLKTLELAAGQIDIWSDDLISHGSNWHDEISSAIERSKAAILLITKNFLASEFIQSTEVPSLLQRRGKLGVRVFPIIARPCAWKAVPWLAEMEVRPKGGTAVFDAENPDQLLAEIVEEIKDAL